MKPKLKPGALFPKVAHTSFVEWTRTRYAGMAARMEKKKLPSLPFSLEEFRADVLGVLGGKEDGAVECRYCHRWFVLGEIAVDHATPLSRGGSAGLENLDYPCSQDNARKGSLTVAEYTALLAFLDTQHPLMRKDVLSRLEKANQLAAGARRTAVLMRNFKATGEWKMPAKAKAPVDDGLGAF